jgi:hypothetical protein
MRTVASELLCDCLEKGRLLFHGSDIIAEALRPARATNHGQRSGDTRVFATELPSVWSAPIGEDALRVVLPAG